MNKYSFPNSGAITLLIVRFIPFNYNSIDSTHRTINFTLMAVYIGNNSIIGRSLFDHLQIIPSKKFHLKTPMRGSEKLNKQLCEFGCEVEEEFPMRIREASWINSGFLETGEMAGS